MKLVVKCHGCRHEMHSPNKAHSRIKYYQKYGEEFQLKCPQCNQQHTYEVDDIRAEDYGFKELILNRIIVLSANALISFALGMFFFGPAVGILLAVVTTLVHSLLAKKNNSAANLEFNKHKLKGRMRAA